MRAIIISLILLGLLGCKNHKGNYGLSQVKAEEGLSELPLNKFQEFDSIKTFSLPFGPKELLTTKFPRDTTIVFGHNLDERPQIEQQLERITEYFQIFNLWSAEDSTRIKRYQKEQLYISESDRYNYYDIPLISKMVKSEIDTSLYYCRPFDCFVLSGKLVTKKNLSLFFYTTFPKYYGKNIHFEHCENYVVDTDLVVQSKDGEIKDVMSANYYTIEPYDTTEKYSYIDDDLIITQVSFVGGETYQFIRKEKWQIKPNGKFVRYYENDGAFKNGEEFGMVKNNMREGKWIETKPNGFVDEQTYLEAEYKEGEPIGNFRFYSFKNNLKGELLYIETYKDEMLLKRSFIE